MVPTKTSSWDKWKVIFAGISVLLLATTFALATVDKKVGIHDKDINAHLELQNKRNEQYNEILKRFGQTQTNDSLLLSEIRELKHSISLIERNQQRLDR